METHELLRALLDQAKERKESMMAILSGTDKDGISVTGDMKDVAKTFVMLYMRNDDVRDAINGLVFLTAPIIFAKTPNLKLHVDAKILEAQDIVKDFDETDEKLDALDKKNPNEALAEYMMQYGFIAKD